MNGVFSRIDEDGAFASANFSRMRQFTSFSFGIIGTNL